MRGRALAVWLMVAAPVAAFAQEQKKQPPPEFSGGYAPPGFTTPLPRAEIFSLVDAGLLLLMLSLATYFVLYRRSRRELRVVLIFSVLYFGWYRQGCVCSIGAIQNVTQAISDSGYALPFIVGAFFLLPLLFALFVGRVFCSGVCPLGAIQDLVLIRPRQVPVPAEHALGLIPYAYLGAAVLFAATGTGYIICQYDPFIAFFRLGGGAGMVAFGAGMLLLGTQVGRPYCRFLCPYGVLLRWASVFSRRRVTITPSKCVQCHLCADECPFGAIRPPAPEPSFDEKQRARKGLGRAILLLPALVAVGALLGYLGSPSLVRMNRDVALAERIWAEDQGRVLGQTESSLAFRNLGLPAGTAYYRAVSARRKITVGSALLGAWIGLVVGLKLASLTIRRPSPDYVADTASCLSCARCYQSCPVEQERLQLAADV